jgi:cytoskeletal protein CcmA (bactofilin family)
MALAVKDRVKETTTTTGTGTYTLAGAVTGFETFGSVGNSNTTYYCCTDGTNFEVGIGTYTSSGTTLARTTILQSSNSDSAVNWSAGTRTIFCTYPADKAVFKDASDDVTLKSSDGAILKLQSSDTTITDGSVLGAIEFSAPDEASGTDAILTSASIVAEADATFAADANNTDLVFKLGASEAAAEKMRLTHEGTLEIPGNADIDGTLEADAITVNGTALDTHIAGVTVTNATNSAHVLVTDNESTNEENLITFVEGATDSTGNVGLEMDGNLSYNPSTGTVTATIFKGNIDADDGDFDGTLEADAITVGGTALNTVIAGVTVANATTAAVATTVTITDNESTNEDNAIIFTAGGDVDGGNIGLESDGDLHYNPSTGTVTATIFKGNIDAVDGDFDGTLEADAITVNGTALNTVIANEATALAIALG